MERSPHLPLPHPATPPLPPPNLACNPLVKGSLTVLPLLECFLQQSVHILTAVAQQQRVLQEKIVWFLFPDEFPSSLSLSVDTKKEEENMLSWTPPSEVLTTAEIVVVGNNVDTSSERGGHVITIALTMKNLPHLTPVVTTVHNLIGAASEETASEFLTNFESALPATSTFFKGLFLGGENVPYVRGGETGFALSAAFDRAKFKEKYPEILHVLDTVASMDVLFQDPRAAGDEGPLRIHLDRFHVEGSVDLRGQHVLWGPGGREIRWSPDEDGELLVKVDPATYLSRFGWLSLKWPRITLKLKQKKRGGEGGALKIEVSVDAMESHGGVLSRLLPLGRLSKYLREGFSLVISVGEDGTFHFEQSLHLPHLPKWIVKLLRSFMKTTAGGGILILRDLVVCALQDAKAINEQLSK